MLRNTTLLIVNNPFLQQFVRGFKKVIITDYINKLADSNIRATILSVESLVSKLIYAMIIPIFGWFADVYSLTQALSIIGITALIVGVIVIILLKKNKVF